MPPVTKRLNRPVTVVRMLSVCGSACVSFFCALLHVDHGVDPAGSWFIER